MIRILALFPAVQTERFIIPLEGTCLPNVMMKENTIAAYPAWPWANKFGLASHWKVGVRTIENWLSWGIIQGRMERGEILMHIPACDAQLMQYTAAQPQIKKKGKAHVAN
jgi:hypothetical protein